MNYSEKLKDPKWQKKRLSVLNRDEFTCQRCFSIENTLHVHHKFYLKVDPWEYSDDALITLCEDCHETEKKDRPKAERMLIASFRKRFLSDEVIKISKAIESMPMNHVEEVIASVYVWALTNSVLQQTLIDKFFEKLKNDRVK
jgi:hypothetical protein